MLDERGLSCLWWWEGGVQLFLPGVPAHLAMDANGKILDACLWTTAGPALLAGGCGPAPWDDLMTLTGMRGSERVVAVGDTIAQVR